MMRSLTLMLIVLAVTGFIALAMFGDVNWDWVFASQVLKYALLLLVAVLLFSLKAVFGRKRNNA